MKNESKITLSAQDLWNDLVAVRETAPLVHSITNLVVMSYNANVLLALGAAPVMAHAREEVEEMVSIAGALVLNIGTLQPEWVEAMKLATKKATSLNKPIILDPVGAGATSYRNRTIMELLVAAKPAVIRGNTSEIMSVSGLTSASKGVENIQSSEAAIDAAKTRVRNTDGTVCVSGARTLLQTIIDISDMALKGWRIVYEAVGLESMHKTSNNFSGRGNMTFNNNAIRNCASRYRTVLKKRFPLNMFGSLAAAGMLAFAGNASAVINVSDTPDGGVLISGGTLPDGVYETSKNISVGSGNLTLGSIAEGPATISTTGKMTLSGGDISVTTSGNKVSGALQTRPDNNKSLAVVPGTEDSFIPNTDPNLKPAVHTISAQEGMTLQGTSINLGAPRVPSGSNPSWADIDRNWEGARLDLKTAGDMSIQSGDFRVANLSFAIRNEADAALRFDADGAMNVSGGTFTLEGQGIANPAAQNYEMPSLMSLKARKDLVIGGGTFNIKSARLHLNSTDGKVVINGGEFNIDNTSPYPGWKTFEPNDSGSAALLDPAHSTHDLYGVPGVLDTASELEVNGGTFNIGSKNSLPGTSASTLSAGRNLNWNGGTLIASGSGGNLIGKEGINIKSGTIKSLASESGQPLALNFKTDGDMLVGEKGTAGPEIYSSEGVIGFMKATNDSNAPGTLYLNSGSITLDGQSRSTLAMGNLNSVINGGTLNIITGDAINRLGTESASMWTLPLRMESGALNLYNSQIASKDALINGGMVTMLGDSSLNGSGGKISINGGTINVGERSFIGAIKNDSLALSPSPTTNGDITIGSGAVMNFAIKTPLTKAAGLTVGSGIGGIYATEAGATISIADGAHFNFNGAFDLEQGLYTAEGFIESKAGTVNMNTLTTDMPFYSTSIAKTANNKADLTINIKDMQQAFNALSNNPNVRDNALTFQDIARNAGDAQIGGVMTTLFNTADTWSVAEGFRQIANENALGGMYAARSNMDTFRNRLTENGSLLGNGFTTSTDTGHNSRLWLSGMGDWAKTRSKNGITGFNTSAGGFALGYDYTTDNNKLRLGVGLGYLNSSTESSDNLTKVNGGTWYGALYTSANLDPVYLDLNVTYGHTNNDLKTSIRIPGLQGQNNASFGTEMWAASLQGSYQFKFNGGATVVATYTGMEYLSIRQSSFTESGILPRSVGGIHESVFTVPVGVRTRHTFVSGSRTVTPEVGIAYARDLNGFRPVARTSYSAGSYLAARGVDAGKDAMRLDVGVSTSLSHSVKLLARYALEVRSHAPNNQITASLEYTF